ncbi:MAG: aldehyde dehydrogenase family protein, partial [Streptosporangiaceae bacterium]
MSTAMVAGVDVDTRHWIGGRRVASGATFTDLSPIDEQPLAEVARGGQAEVGAAVRAAGEAFAGWSATPPGDRAQVLHAIADGITERAADLAEVETADNGALLRSHLRSVMPRAAQNFRFFADWLGRLGAGDLEIGGHREQVSWAPSGVTAVITPLELGGKSPLLVFADADLDLAVAHAVGQYDNAGQVCLAGTRLLVEEAVAEEFVARFISRAAGLKQGDPRDEGTEVGPNITRQHLARIDGFVRRAVAAGARPLLGGAVNP